MAKKVEPMTGVVRRSGSPNWQLQLEIPKEVASRFTQKQWYRATLGTSDIAAANVKAIPLIAEFRAKVDLYRRELEIDAREESYASDIMDLVTSSGVLRSKTPKDAAPFVKESTILAVRAGQRTIDEVRKELNEANHNVLYWSTTAQALREALNVLESNSVSKDNEVVTLSRLLERRCEKFTPKQAEGYRAVAKFAMSVVGDIAVKDVDKATARRLRDAVEGAPFADGTKKRNYGLIVALFNWAVSDGILDANIFDGVSITTTGKKAYDRGDLTYADVSLMVREFCTQGPLHRFLPLLMLTTGARPEETAQLQVSDVMKCKDGTPFIRIHETDETGVKNVNSVRDVPIIPLIWDELGMSDYYEARKAERKQTLFELTPRSGRYARRFVEKYHTPWKTKHGWGIERGPHALRHLFTFTFANYSEKGADSELREMILGHIPTTTNVAGVYNKGYTLPRARAGLESINWKALVDFTPLLAGT